jgi:hypothetical protein
VSFSRLQGPGAVSPTDGADDQRRRADTVDRRLSLGGINPSDFTIAADGCSRVPLGYEQSWAINANVTPAAIGAGQARQPESAMVRGCVSTHAYAHRLATGPALRTPPPLHRQQTGITRYRFTTKQR